MRKVLIVTCAHNEAQYLPQTISAVARQSLLPARWVIIDDASTDQTFDIVQHYAKSLDFIMPMIFKRVGGRSFGNKANAFNAAVNYAKIASFDIIGNLDADIILGPNFVQNIVERFRADPKLGITGGIVYTKSNDGFTCRDTNPNSVAGAVQFFRKECFVAIGGSYKSMPYGGIDAAAEFQARVTGWNVRKDETEKVWEQRATGSAEHTRVRACIRLGKRFYTLGYPLHYYILRCCFRIKDRPLVLNSLFAFLGYMQLWLQRKPYLIPRKTVLHMREYHRNQLLSFLRQALPTRRSALKTR